MNRREFLHKPLLGTAFLPVVPSHAFAKWVTADGAETNVFTDAKMTYIPAVPPKMADPLGQRAYVGVTYWLGETQYSHFWMFPYKIYGLYEDPDAMVLEFARQVAQKFDADFPL